MQRNFSKGFSLVGLIVVQVLIAMSVVGFMRLLNLGNRATRGIASKANVEQMRALTTQILNKPGICTQIFKGKTFFISPKEPSEKSYAGQDNSVHLKDVTIPDNGLTLASVGQTFDGNATIDSISLSAFAPLMNGSATYIAQLSFQITAPNLSGTPHFTTRIPLVLETKGTLTSREIVSCGSETGSNSPSSDGMDCDNIIGGFKDPLTGKCRVLLESRTNDPEKKELHLGQMWIRTDL